MKVTLLTNFVTAKVKVLFNQTLTMLEKYSRYSEALPRSELIPER